MSNIFIHVYLDEDVSVLIANLLRVRGFQATTAKDAAQLGKSDLEQLQYSTSMGAAILTHNRKDFEALACQYFEQGNVHGDIIIAARHPVAEIVARLLKVLNAYTADELHNQIRYI